MNQRRTDELHRHRHSCSGLTYFVTCCTRGRRPGLTDFAIARALIEHASFGDRAGDIATLALTIMPDHIHWLFSMGDRLSLGQVIGRFKAASGRQLHPMGIEWQRDYFEHRLRPDEDAEAYAHYILLNPYRAGLLESSQRWSWLWLPEPRRFRFSLLLGSDGGIPAEWLSNRTSAPLATGE